MRRMGFLRDEGGEGLKFANEIRYSTTLLFAINFGSSERETTTDFLHRFIFGPLIDLCGQLES